MQLLAAAAPYAKVISAAVRGQRPEALGDGDALAALRSILRPGDTFLDIGASDGQLAAVASRIVGPAGRVVAFEPERAARGRLLRRIGRERCVNTVVEPLRLAEFEMPGVSQTLDAYVARHRLAPSLLRVDTAGTETAVLGGAKQTLESHRRTLIVDFDPRSTAETGIAPPALAAWLESLGYRLAVLEYDAWGRFDMRRHSPFDAALHCRRGASANVVCLAPPRSRDAAA